MSPIDFPDLLEDRGSSDDRGRRKSGGGRLISTLRSRSHSRSRARAERRSASCQPTERTRTAEEKLAEKKKRRSLSRPSSSRQSKEVSTEKFVEFKTSKSKTTKAEMIDLSASKERSKKTRTPSPTKRRSTMKTSNQGNNKPSSKKKEWSADIINLVDRDEDILLDEIMNGKNPNINPILNPTGKRSEKKAVESKSGNDKRVRSSSKSRNKTSPTSSSNLKKDSSHNKRPSSTNNAGGSPKSVVRFPDRSKASAASAYSDEELSDSESESEEEEESNSVATNDLLDQVKSRMEQQRLMEEAKELRKTIEKKDAEIEQLTGQLRMAISTKCDLVIAHTELERLHEVDLKQRDLYAEDMKRANLAMIEMRAEVEKEFMNELTDLSNQVEETEDLRKKEAADKDEIIRLLEEKVRRLELTAMGGQSARGRDDAKVKYYKKKLGVYDQ